jgi:lipid II:glycine glycyltransferase (peptidoglycan interpeptide bridge formation enzyme)
MGSCLFGGTRNVIRNNTRSSHYLNYLRLCESVKRGCKIHDLGYVIVKTPELQEDGTLGELIPQDNFKGIYDFKKSFSADYHEFIGEYILVGNSLKYYSYAKLMPTAKKAKIKAIKMLRR